MAKPLLTIRATIEQPGRAPVQFEIETQPFNQKDPAQVGERIDHCFRQLRDQVRAELLS